MRPLLLQQWPRPPHISEGFIHCSAKRENRELRAAKVLEVNLLQPPQSSTPFAVPIYGYETLLAYPQCKGSHYLLKQSIMT